MITNEEEIKEKIKMAKQIVEDLEEPFKTKGFEVILSKLLEEETETIQKKMKSIGKLKEEVKAIDEIIDSLDRTKYNQIHQMSRNLDKAIFILKIVKDELNIDGLTPSEIARILKEKFRIPVTKEAIGMVLMDAKLLVDREKVKLKTGGFAYKYKIMHSGEEHIENLTRGE